MDARHWQPAERFLEHLKLERRLSENTAKSYRRDLVCLAEFCDRQDIAAFTDLRSQALCGCQPCRRLVAPERPAAIVRSAQLHELPDPRG